jgi:formylglycine-generating enzyme required for sulfatase activity
MGSDNVNLPALQRTPVTIRLSIFAPLLIVLIAGIVAFPGAANAGIVPKESPERFELIFWDSIKDSDNAADYDAYLEAYPQGRFAPLAKARAKSLREQQAKQQRTTSGPEITDMDAEFKVLKNARLREQPDASSENLGTLLRDSRIIVTGRVVDSDWYRIETMDGKSGFVFGTLIEEVQRGSEQAVAEKAAADKAAAEKAAAAAAAAAAAREAQEKAAAAQAEHAAAEKRAAENAARKAAEQAAAEQAAQQRAAEKAAAEAAAQRAAEQAAAAAKAQQAAEEAAAAAAAAEAARKAADAKMAGTTASEVKTFKDCSGCPEMIALPAGSFTMGSKSGDGSEQPAHTVNIAKPFAISRFEVSVAEWKACHEAGACDFMPSRKGMTDTSPVYNLSWLDAQKYVKWLSKQTGKQYRLPSEAEWEYAARAGTKTEYWWGDAVGTGMANCKNCGGDWNRKRPATVDTFEANAFGLQGMNGSVWEWVADCWFDDYEGAPGDGSARDRKNCQSRVLRGGSWRNDASYARSASRFNYDHDVRYVLNGFRVARTMN